MKNLFLTLTLIAIAVSPAIADMGHKMATQCAKVDDFELCFDVMPHKNYQKMMKGMKMEPMKAESDTTHHVAVAIRKDGKRVEDAEVDLKVIGPDKKEETHKLTYNPDMMLQYVGHFNMPKKGKYQVMILFKTGEEKHQGGVFYEVK